MDSFRSDYFLHIQSISADILSLLSSDGVSINLLKWLAGPSALFMYITSSSSTVGTAGHVTTSCSGN